MSDFLTNLAARAIAQPSLRPRTRSRFEPASAEEPAPEWPTVASSERRLPAGRSAGIPAGRIDLHEHEEGPAAWKAAERPAGSQRSADAAEPRTEVQIEADIHREIERDVQRVVETNERVIRVPQIQQVERVIEQRPHRYEQQPPRIIREQEELHRERHVRTTIDRRPQILTQQRMDAPAATQEPTIHVSIGRVEVRAVSQQQPQREKARGDRMTIDDYVARRKAKERR